MNYFVNIPFELLISLFIVVSIILFAIISTVCSRLKYVWMTKVLNYKYYEYCRIPGAGQVVDHYIYLKSDEEAMDNLKHNDFIRQVEYSGKLIKSLKPSR